MAFNQDEQRSAEPGEGILPIQGTVPPIVPPGGTPHEEVGVQAPEPELSVEEQALALVFERWGRRFHGVPPDRFDQIVQSLRNRESIHSIARGLIEQGYCASWTPTSVRINLTRFRDAAGFPKHTDHPEEEKEDEQEELIEEAPVLKRLAWLIRVQHARVRKALNFESQMAGMVLPMASAEMKFLSDLLDKEIQVTMKTGSLKTVPQAVTVETANLPITDPAEAFRVVLAARRLRALLAENPETTEGGEKKPDEGPA